jgi:hypothetical protein
VISSAALLVTPIVVSKGASLIAEIQEASAAAVAEARTTTQVKVELNSRIDDTQQYDKFRKPDSTRPDGEWDWQKQAPNNGAVPGTQVTTTIQPGTTFDRYGNRNGEYMPPAGTALPTSRI